MTPYLTLFGCAASTSGHVVALGAPYDRGGASDRSGCAQAPSVLRTLSAPHHFRVHGGALFDLSSGRKLFDGADLSDIGDIPFRPEMADDDYLESVADHVRAIAEAGKLPLLLGGDHLVTLAALRGLKAALGAVQVLHFDAHEDAGDLTSNARPTHANFISFVEKEGLAEQVLQVGVRGLSWHTGVNTACVRKGSVEDIPTLLQKHLPVYITIDTDVFDPGLASGVSYPEPFGLSMDHFRQALGYLRGAHPHVIGADWMEYNPRFDTPGQLTGRTALHGIADLVGLLSQTSQ